MEGRNWKWCQINIKKKLNASILRAYLQSQRHHFIGQSAVTLQNHLVYTV